MDLMFIDKALADSNVSVRNIDFPDIPNILSYWFDTPGEVLESIGVDLKKLPDRESFNQMLVEKITQDQTLPESQLNALIIEFMGESVGFHTLNPVAPGDHGVFHAHIWKKNLRGKGIGRISYLKACALFMKRFNLKKILFNTPLQNTSAIKIKEKWGLPSVGEQKSESGFLKAGTPTKVFQLARHHVIR